MNRKFLGSLLVTSLTLLATDSAFAQQSATEPIDVTIAQNEPLELIFPNVFDPLHPKVLELHGVLAGPNPGTLAIFFDWIDPDGTKHFSPVTEFVFAPGLPNQVDLTFTIPYCPPQVSVDFRLGDASVVRFVGEFTHTCIPEPSSSLMGALALAGLGCFARRKRQS